MIFFFYYVSLPLATLFEEEAQVSEYMGCISVTAADVHKLAPLSHFALLLR
jgi:hypothetical protein